MDRETLKKLVKKNGLKLTLKAVYDASSGCKVCETWGCGLMCKKCTAKCTYTCYTGCCNFIFACCG